MGYIVNTTRMTKKQYLHFCQFSTYKNLGAVLIIIFFAWVFTPWLFFLGFTPISIYCILAALVPTLIYLLIIFLLFYIAPMAEYKKLKHNAFEYSFYADEFEAKANDLLIKSSSQSQYTIIKKAYERKDAFYLYISKREAHIVSKGGFTSGTADDLRQILKDKLGKKFKCKKRV